MLRIESRIMFLYATNTRIKPKKFTYQVKQIYSGRSKNRIQPKTDNRHQITDNRQQITDNRQPKTENRKPITDNR